jgi:hypothetical protein
MAMSPAVQKSMKGRRRTIPHLLFFKIFPPGGSVDKQMEVPTVADHGGIESILNSFVCSKKIKQ